MTGQLEQRWSIGRDLATQLGVDPDLPVIEWHTLVAATPEPPPPPPPPGDSYSVEVAADAPARWYRLGEGTGTVMVDASTNVATRKDGTYTATPPDPVATLATGSTNGARLFAAQRYGQATPTGVVWSGATPFSVEAWIKPGSTGGTIVARHNSVAPCVFDLIVNAGKVEFRWANPSWKILVGPAVTAGEIYHVVGTWDGVTRRIYLNGALAASDTPAGGPAYNTSPPVSVGPLGNGYASSGFPGGTIDEVALYPAALSAARVLAHYTAANPPPPPPPPPPAETTYTWEADPDRTAALAGYRVDYARKAVTERGSALACSAQLVGPLLAGRLPVVGERFRLTISDPVATALGLAAEDRPRFTGQVTDVDVDDRGWVNIVGTGLRARLGRITVGADKRWPAELDGYRMTRVLTAAVEQLPQLAVGQVDDGVVTLTQREPAAASADVAVDDVLTSANSLLIEQRSGQLDYHDRDHRRGAVVRLTLDAQLLRPFRWAQGIGGVINRALVGWGADSPQRQAVVENAASTDQATGLGPIEQTTTTQLAYEADAYAMGSDVVGRRAWPTWQLPACNVELVRNVSGALRGQLLALRHGDLIHLAQLPPGGPYTAADAWVEGTEEVCTRTSWTLTLAVSDYDQGGVSLRWVDIPEGVSWELLRADLTWLDLATTAPTDLT